MSQSKNKGIKLAPSILSADFGRLAHQLDLLEQGGADYVHIDVMDGIFVPNITIGLPVVSSLKKCSNLTFDTHLMITRPERYSDKFARAGADIISFHFEACDDPWRLIRQIRSLNKRVSVAIGPDESVERIFRYIHELDMVLIMSVYPGFGGQSLIMSALEKAEKLRSYAINHNIDVDIEMDGGINLDNVRDVLDSGVNVVVVGSAVFEAEDIPQALRQFREIICRGGY